MNSPIRILHIFGIMDRGGAETMIMNYYRQIDRTKLQFDFLVLRSERGAYEDEIESLGGKVFRVPPIFSYFAHKNAVKQFFDEHPEYTIIHGHIGELGYCIYKEAKHRRIPNIIVHAHNAECDHDWKWLFRLLLRQMCRPLVSIPMTCSTDAAIWLFGKKMASRAIMLNNAIESAKFTYNVETRNQVRATMGWHGKYVIGNVGRFNPQKNHYRLIDIFSQQLKTYPNSLLVLIGDKSYLYESIKKRVYDLGINQNVQFLGSRSDVHHLMQGMDVFCFPSLYEGFGVALLEAQASGLHAVISDKIPNTAIVKPNLVTICSLTAANKEWIKNLNKDYKRMSTYDDIVTAGFDIANNAVWLEHFYRKLSNEK